MHLCQDEAQKFLRYDQVFVWRFDSAESIVAIFKNKLKDVGETWTRSLTYLNCVS